MDPWKGYKEDAELGDEDDPEYREEMFRTFRHMKVSPQQIKDQKFAAEYADWLKTAPPEDEEE